MVVLVVLFAAVVILGVVWLLISMAERRQRRQPKKPIRKAEKTDRRVFCKDCKHFKVSPIAGVPVEKCLVAEERVDPVDGVKRVHSYPRMKNMSFDCPDHTPHGAERIRRGHKRG